MGRQLLQKTIFLGFLYLMFIGFPGCFEKYKDVCKIFKTIRILSWLRTEPKDIKPNQNRVLELTDYSKNEKTDGNLSTFNDSFTYDFDAYDSDEEISLLQKEVKLIENVFKNNSISSSSHEKDYKDEIKQQIQAQHEKYQSMKIKIAGEKQNLESLLKQEQTKHRNEYTTLLSNEIKNKLTTKKPESRSDVKEEIQKKFHQKDQVYSDTINQLQNKSEKK